MARSRLLKDVHFTIPIRLYRKYLREQAGAGPAPTPAPVGWIAEEGFYRLAIDAKRQALLKASVAVRAFQPDRCRNLPVLTTAFAWEKVTVNGKPADLAAEKGWFRFTPAEPGRYVISAQVPLKRADPGGTALGFGVPKTVRTMFGFDSPGRWEVTVRGAARALRGLDGQGTHGQLAFAPRDRLDVKVARPIVLPPRPPRYELSGVVAWNIDTGWQQVAARLRVGILGGRTDRLNLTLPPAARRVRVTGPDVREAQVSGGRVAVFLRGRIPQQTRLDVRYELPLAKGSIQRLRRIQMDSGHWSGGTLVITNTAGGSEILAHTVVGLREMHSADLPASARAILAGKPVIAYQITSRSYSAAIDVIDLGEFALRESIADLAHYQLVFHGDGAILCKADYEIRNRGRQFLRVDLPRGARVLLARVNDKSRPITPIAGQADAYLLPLIRSKASVKGLVSFPVEIVLVYRGQALSRSGQASVPLPRIDLPIAYGWCEFYVPDGMRVRRWSGPMRRVEQYSSETAVATLSYGRGELAEGYEERDRPMVGARPERAPARPGAPEPVAAAVPPATRPSVRQTARWQVYAGGTKLTSSGLALLGRNYFRAGRDYYERGNYAEALRALQNAVELSPKGPEAANARRLISNIRMVQGKLAMKSREEKAVGRQVQKELSALNVELEQQQRTAIEKGLQAVRAGRLGEAKAQFTAAESLGQQLVARGADEKRQTAVLRGALEQLDRLRTLERAQVEELRERYKSLKGAKKYEEALQIGKTLQEFGERDGGLREELAQLAVKTVQRRGQRPAVRGQPPAGPSAEAIHALVPGAATAARYPVRAIPVKHADPVALAKTLEQTLSGAARRGARDEAVAPKGDVVVEGDRRSNALLVRADDKTFEDIRNLTARLDAPSSAGERTVKVVKPERAGAVARRRVEDTRAAYVARPLSFDRPVARLKDGRFDIDGGVVAGGGGRGRAGRGTVRRVYDVRDLIVGVPEFKGPRIELRGEGPRPGRRQVTGALFDDSTAPRPGSKKAGKERIARDFLDLVKQAVDRDLPAEGEGRPRDPGIQIRNGQLIVTQTEENQRAVADLIGKLRQVRGPQVELGGSISRQRAAGLVALAGKDADGVSGVGGLLDVGRAQAQQADNWKKLAESSEFQDFLRRNYDWQIDVGKTAGGSRYGLGTRYEPTEDFYFRALGRPGGTTGGGKAVARDLSGKLLSNLGQKVAVNSVNIDLDARAANVLGIAFAAGVSGVSYAVVDEAQLRTLREVEARRPRERTRVAPNQRLQETIIGTDALLANGWLANVSFAGDVGNTLDVKGNAVSLPHGKYVLINNGGYLTAVQAGEMQHWTQQVKPVEFAEVPQDIEVPRAGRLVKFEKTLIKPTDKLAIRAQYNWKGAD